MRYICLVNTSPEREDACTSRKSRFRIHVMVATQIAECPFFSADVEHGGLGWVPGRSVQVQPVMDPQSGQLGVW